MMTRRRFKDVDYAISFRLSEAYAKIEMGEDGKIVIFDPCLDSGNLSDDIVGAEKIE